MLAPASIACSPQDGAAERGRRLAAVTGAEHSKFETLCAILDRMIDSGIQETTRRAYSQAYQSVENLSQARALAFIHRYLEVTKNITEFADRERLITDGTMDGGIDAYHVDIRARVVTIIQSKFRATAENFRNKVIDADELAAIDLDILRGKAEDNEGTPYNGKIRQLIREIGALENPSTYSYKLILLANVRSRSHSVLAKLFSDIEVEVWDFQRSYAEIVLPVIKGEQYSDPRLSVSVDVQRKNKEARLTSEVTTALGVCSVTIVLVPTVEIAKATSKYKNTLLRSNPRAYLGEGSAGTNAGIRSSICDIETGEFAILNNGLTIVVDDVYFSPAVGRVGQAEMTLVNPQIVNGGQTAFTLSNVWEGFSQEDRLGVFRGKEIITKVIKLPLLTSLDRQTLVQQISEATNTQTSVLPADRVANPNVQRAIMDRMFLRTGLLYEYRSGEFWQALSDGTIDDSKIVERALFTRLFLISAGEYSRATARSVFKKGRNQFNDVPNDDVLERIAFLWDLYTLLHEGKRQREEPRQLFTLAKTQVALMVHDQARERTIDLSAKESARRAKRRWTGLLAWTGGSKRKYFRQEYVRKTGESRNVFDLERWLQSTSFPKDVERYLNSATQEEFAFEMAEPENNLP